MKLCIVFESYVNNGMIMHKVTREARKNGILSAATAAFLEDGYGPSNIDDIAKRAGVSKPTVYKHFDSKIDLFCAMIEHIVNDMAHNDKDGLAYAKSLPPRDGLLYAANQMVERFYKEELVRLYRLIIGESRQFPEMNEALAQCFCNVCHEQTDALLRHYVDEGLAKVEDIEAATRQFMVLLEEPIIYRLFMRREDLPGQKESNEIVRRSVNMFWNYYKK